MLSLNVKKKISVKALLFGCVFLYSTLTFTNVTNAMFSNSEEEIDCSNIAYNSYSQSDEKENIENDDDNPSKIPLLPMNGDPDHKHFVENKVTAWKDHNKDKLVSPQVNEFDEYLPYVEEKLNVFDTERTQKYGKAIEWWIKETNESPSTYQNSIAALELMKKRGIINEFDDETTELTQGLSEKYNCEYVLENLNNSLNQADQEYNDKVNKLFNELKVYFYDDCDKELNFDRIKVEYPVRNGNNSEADGGHTYYDDDCDNELNWGHIEVKYPVNNDNNSEADGYAWYQKCTLI